MNKALLNLLMQFLIAAIQSQVQKTVGAAMAQGFTRIPNPEDPTPDEAVHAAKVALAEHIGVDVAELDDGTNGSGNLVA